MYNTTDLLNAVIRNQGMPQNSPIKFSSTDLIAFLNEELRWLVQTELLLLREEFFTCVETIPLVASQSTYVIPQKAVAWSLDEVYWVGADGIERRLARRTRRHEELGGTTAPAPSGVFLEGVYVHTFPNISASPDGSLRFVYSRIQNLLRLVGDCARITNVATVGTDYVLTVSNIPLGYANTVDFVGGKSPYELFAVGTTASVLGLSITSPISAFDRPPVVGDYICETGYTVYPHIPSEWHPLLAQAATAKSLEAGGDAKNAQIASARLGVMIEEMKRATRDRIGNAPKKIVPRNYVLNAQRFRRFGWY